MITPACGKLLLGGWVLCNVVIVVADVASGRAVC